MSKAQRINFDDLKAKADYRTVLAHYGLAIVGQGDQAKILCPFHDDARPSCSVNLAKGVWHCFACHASGNVLDFVHRMETRNGATVSLRQAGLKLAEISGVNLDGHSGVEGRQEPRRAPIARGTAIISSDGQNGAPPGSEPAGAASGNEARPTRNKPLGFALTLDAEHPYLVERGVPPAGLILPFGLGYCAKGSMAGRCCVPIHNALGELVAYAGRWVGRVEDLPDGEEKWKLPKGFHKSLELFNLHRVKHCRHLVVVEGFFGAMRLHGLRIPSVALMGSSLADEQVMLLLEHCHILQHVTVLMDGDEAGRKAAPLVAARLCEHWWTRTASLSDGTQPDTVELDALEHLLRRKGT